MEDNSIIAFDEHMQNHSDEQAISYLALEERMLGGSIGHRR
jgi:hypothetical protein